MANSETVLLTGATGFLGTHVAERLATSGAKVIGVARRALAASDPALRFLASYVTTDMSDPAPLADLLAQHAPALCIHLAGPASVPASMERPLDDFDGQLLPLSRLLEAIRCEGGSTRTLLVSSAAVYGEPVAVPVAEEAPLKPISAYGFHKLQQEHLTQEYQALFGLRTANVRIFSTFGEGLRRLAVWDIARRALQGDHRLQGTGLETRDYLYVGDVAAALVAIAARTPFQGEAINVASGRETTIAALAALIYAELGLAAVPSFDGHSPAGTPRRWRGDVHRLEALGFRPSLTLDEGLRRTMDWIRRSG